MLRAWEGGLSSTTVGIFISKSLGTFWIFGSIKVIRPKIKQNEDIKLEGLKKKKPTRGVREEGKSDIYFNKNTISELS